MKLKRRCVQTLWALNLLIFTATGQSAFAERFRFSLDGLGVTETSQGQKFGGRITVDGDRMVEPQILEFDLIHGDRGNEQTLEVGLRHQGEAVLEAVFNLFGLESDSRSDRLDIN